jgi:hypothetical protein
MQFKKYTSLMSHSDLYNRSVASGINLPATHCAYIQSFIKEYLQNRLALKGIYFGLKQKRR